jgi:hypothetical protein
MRNIIFAVPILWLSLLVNAATIQVSDQYGIGEISIDTDTDVEYFVDFEPKKIVMISGDINIPVQVDPAAYTVHAPGESLVTFSDDGNVRTVVANRIEAADNDAGWVYTSRPTLFVSLCGFEKYTNEDDNCVVLRDTIDSTLNKDGSYQFMHLRTEWNSNEQIDRQDDDLARWIIKELEGKAYAWDVVVIGYSRGGIFAHDMSEKLVKSGLINNLYTVLLDPTTAKEFRDTYPREEFSSSGTNHYGSLYYDSKAFSGDNIDIFEYSDMDISGYTNFGNKDFYMNSNHVDFPDDWADQKWQTFYSRFLATKTSGSYNPDGPGGIWAVDVDSRAKNIFEGGVELGFDNDGVGMDAYMCVDVDPSGTGPSTLCASTGLSVSSDGIYAETVVPVVMASRLAVTSKHVQLAYSTPVQSFYLSIENSEINLNVSNFVNVAEIKTVIDPSDLELDVSFDYLIDDLEININVRDFAGSVSNELADIEDSVVGTVVKVGGGVTKSGSWAAKKLSKLL